MAENKADETRRELTAKIAGILTSQQGIDAGISTVEAIDELGTIALNYTNDEGDEVEFFVFVTVESA
jgi:hypothetical protein